jgi:MerR family transcriptional regulator, light-induced transcriptional regulator
MGALRVNLLSTVPPEREFIAELLRVESATIADHACRALARRHPDVVARWGTIADDQRALWMQAMLARIHELASSVLAGLPEVFGAQVLWSYHAYRARRLPTGDLSASLGALRTAVREVVPAEDYGTVEPYLAAATAMLSSDAPPPPQQISASTPRGKMAAEFLLAVLEGERRRACETLTGSVSSGAITVPEVYEHVLAPAMREMGRMWHLGEVNIAEEHFATSTCLTAMSQLLPLWPRKPLNGRTMLAAAVAGNNHEIGVRMVADAFEAEGWRSIYLGANVPGEDLALAAADYGASVACLGITLTAHLQALRDSIRALRGAGHLKIIVGGPGFHNIPALAYENGADAFAATPGEALSLADA